MITALSILGVLLLLGICLAISTLVVWIIDIVPVWVAYAILMSPIWAFMLWLGFLVIESLLKKWGVR